MLLKKKLYYIALCCLISCHVFTKNQKKEYTQQIKELNNQTKDFRLDTLTLVDSARNRVIPVAFYVPTQPLKRGFEVVIFSHGYGQNRGGDYLAYSYLTENLAKHGYFVASIQHELPTDSLLPTSGIPQVVRRPFWDRGVENILFVINTLRKKKLYHLNFENITLIGHSNGGDMTALFPQKHPNIVQKIITLDHRRMALPRAISPQILTLRSSDQVADEGVLPTEIEQKKYNITIVKLPNTIHNDMDDNANPQQRIEINQHILRFLSKL